MAANAVGDAGVTRRNPTQPTDSDHVSVEEFYIDSDALVFLVGVNLAIR